MELASLRAYKWAKGKQGPSFEVMEGGGKGMKGEHYLLLWLLI